MLHSDEEMEYVFAARKGQKVTIKNSDTIAFDVRVFSDEAGFDNDYNSSATFSLKLPADGDYLLYVRKKHTRIPKRGRFSITFTIK